jgi:hypothetical protein
MPHRCLQRVIHLEFEMLVGLLCLMDARGDSSKRSEHATETRTAELQA